MIENHKGKKVKGEKGKKLVSSYSEVLTFSPFSLFPF